jgi:hypothetical protein
MVKATGACMKLLGAYDCITQALSPAFGCLIWSAGHLEAEGDEALLPSSAP